MTKLELSILQSDEVTHENLCRLWEAIKDDLENLGDDIEGDDRVANLQLLQAIEHVVYGVYGTEILDEIKEKFNKPLLDSDLDERPWFYDGFGCMRSKKDGTVWHD